MTRQALLSVSAAALTLGVLGGISRSDAAVDVLYVESQLQAYWANAVGHATPAETSYWQKSPLASQGYTAGRTFSSSHEIAGQPGTDIALGSVARGLATQETTAAGLGFSASGKGLGQTVWAENESATTLFASGYSKFYYVFDVLSSPETLTLNGNVHADPYSKLQVRVSRSADAGATWATLPGFSNIERDGTEAVAFNQTWTDAAYALAPGFRYQIDFSADANMAYADSLEPVFTSEAWFNMGGVVPEPGIIGTLTTLATLPLLRRRRMARSIGQK